MTRVNDRALLLLITGLTVLPGLLAIGLLAWLHRRNRRRSSFGTATHAAALERAAARHRLTLPREEVLRRGRRAILGAALRLSLLFAFFLAIPILIHAIRPMPRGTMAWIGGLGATLLAFPAGFAIATLRQLRRWPLDRSFAFVSPSAGLVLLGPTRWFHRGAVHPYPDTTFVRNPGGVQGVGRVVYSRTSTGTRRTRELAFDWPPSVGTKARAEITALLVGASAPPLPFGRAEDD